MGGIAGIIRFDGQSIDSTDVNNITRLLKHRGNVLSRSIDNGLMLSFDGTIEASLTAPVVATVDADIFSQTFTDQPFCSSYIQSGPSSFNDFNADFAVALWDAHQQALYCVRDAMGVKPLYYVYQPNRFFAFASEIKALTILREVTVKPNRHKFREYLTWPTTYVAYSEETFYETIFSVLPGHYLQVNAQKIVQQAYWQVDLEKFRNIGGVEEYSTLFRNYFTTAIDNRIKTKQRIGSQLSGGLDSSSVSSVAQSLLLKQQRPSLYTFNVDTEKPFAEEQNYVKAVVDKWQTNHYRLHPVADVLDSVLKINHIFDRPEQFIIPSSFHLSVSLQAQELGCDILLTGEDGDGVITPGFEFLDDLVSANKWDEFKIASQQFVAPQERNLYYIDKNWVRLNNQTKYEKYVLVTLGSYLMKQFGQQSLATFFSMISEQKQRFGLSESAIISYVFDRIRRRFTDRKTIDHALSEDFKQQVLVRPQQSTERLVATLSSENNINIAEILNNTNVICNEQMNHIGAYYGHQYSFPFFDKNVVELGLATPMAIRFNGGLGRGLIRHGLQNILPPTVLSRVTKANFVEYGTLSAQQLYEAIREQLLSTSNPIWEIIDRRVFMKIVDIVYNSRFPLQRKTRYNWLLCRIIYLSIWLSSLE